MYSAYSFSGFACNGKTTFLQKLSKDRNAFLFTEHAGDCLEIGNELYGVWDDFIQFQTSLLVSEYERLKFIQVNKHLPDQLFLFDRFIVDILTFINHHNRSGRIKNIPDMFVEKIAEYAKNKLNSKMIFNKSFIIQPCQNSDFIMQNCIRKDRTDTICFSNFKNEEKLWFDDFKINFYNFQKIYPISNELIELPHPADIGFDEFEKMVKTLI